MRASISQWQHLAALASAKGRVRDRVRRFAHSSFRWIDLRSQSNSAEHLTCIPIIPRGCPKGYGHTSAAALEHNVLHQVNWEALSFDVLPINSSVHKVNWLKVFRDVQLGIREMYDCNNLKGGCSKYPLHFTQIPKFGYTYM